MGDSQFPEVLVDQREKIDLAPSIVGPLFDCGRKVFVRDVHPNAQVLVFAKRGGGPEFPISDLVTIRDTTGSIAVNPYLHSPDDVFVAQWACGNQRLDSQIVHVAPQPPLHMPSVEGYLRKQLYDGAQSVMVTGAVSGALIEVYAIGSDGSLSFLSQEVAHPSGKTRVMLPRPLMRGDLICTRQMLCEKVSEFTSPPSEVWITPNLTGWLNSNQSIASAIVWETPNGIQTYSSWSSSMKDDLTNAFKAAWNFGSVFPSDPAPNKRALSDAEQVVQVLDQSDAWLMFISYVAQSLVVEMGPLVGWSILNYSSSGLAALLDSRQTFLWNGSAGGYEIRLYPHGTALPCAPDFCYKFLLDKVDSNRIVTMANLLDWCRNNLAHFLGGLDTKNVYDQWQYRGFPPVSRIIQSTPNLSTLFLGKRHWTAGCWGTTGFLRAMLRTVNIPVMLVTHCGHAQPNFIEDGLYLSHGDDPYNALTTSSPAMAISEILINQSEFDAWFGTSVPTTNQCQNIGRRPTDLALEYLPNYLLKAHCDDIANGKSHSDGKVFDLFKRYYAVTELEGKQFWERMDSKIAALGGCANF